MNLCPAAFIVPLLCCALAAQRTFVVDPGNGPGTDFTDLSVALGQAQHGDVYLLRPGTHAAAATDKGVSLLGTAAGVVLTSLKVAGVPAGRSFALANAGVQTGFVPLGPSLGLVVENCAGNVHLNGLSALFTGNGSPYGPAVSLLNAANVTMLNARFAAYYSCTGMVTQDSTLVAVDCVMQGKQSLSLISYGSSPGLTIKGAASRVEVCGGTYSGGSSNPTAVGGSPGIHIDGGSLTLRVTDQPTLVQAGSNTLYAVTALQVSGTGTATIDPAVQLVPSKSAAPVQGPYVLTRLPGLATTGGALGGPLNATLVSPAGDAFGMFLGLAQAPVDYPFGSLFVDLSSIVLIATGVQGATGSLAVNMTVPSLPALRGQAIVFQAVSQSAATQAFLVTNPAVPILGA